MRAKLIIIRAIRAFKALGARHALVEALAPFRKSGTWTLRTPLTRYPLTARVGTSDLDVFRTIFLRGEYQRVLNLEGVRTVIDCGANVGYVSALLLSAYPECRVVAVEPDSSNFALLQQNLAPYGDRVRLYHAGVWSHPAHLVIDERPYRYNNSCSLQVREWREGDPPGMQAIDLNSIITEAGWERVSILKVDIEGAECVVFTQGDRSWVDRVDAMVVEVHNDSHFGSGSAALAEITDGFDVAITGDVAFATRNVGEAVDAGPSGGAPR